MEQTRKLPPEGVVVMSVYDNGYETINWIENGKQR